MAHSLPAAGVSTSSDVEEASLLGGSATRPRLGGPGCIGAAVAAGWSSGAACILGSALIFACAAAFVKAAEQLDPRVSVWQVIFIRSSLALALSAATARARGISPLFGSPPYRLLALRGTFGTASMACFYFSLVKLPLADAITLLFLNPAFCALLGRVLLGEHCGWLTGVGCGASLAGVVMVAQPPFILHLMGGSTAQAGQAWSQARLAGVMLGIAGALLASFAYLTVRVIGKSSPSLSVASWFHGVSLLAGAVPTVLGIPQPAVVPNAPVCACLLGLGCSSFAAQLLLNRGFQVERAARASAFNYSQVVWAHVIGVAFFAEQLTLLGVAGAAVIAAGVLAVSLDKQTASGEEAVQGAAGGEGHCGQEARGQDRLVQMQRTKAKGSFGREPDDADEESPGRGPAGDGVAAAQPPLQPHPT